MNTPYTRAQQTGLALLGLLSLADIALLFLTDGEHPPYSVAILGAVLGLASILLVVKAFRDPGRPIRLLVGLRVLSALTSLPAFFLTGVPGPARLAAAVTVVLTGAGILLAGSPRTALVTS